MNWRFTSLRRMLNNNFFQQRDRNTLILGGLTLEIGHCSHSPWHQGVEVEEVGGGEGTPVELVIFAYIMFVPL